MRRQGRCRSVRWVPGSRSAITQGLPSRRGKVTVEIEAEVREGVSDDIQRVINENCQTLHFKSHGFEES